MFKGNHSAGILANVKTSSCSFWQFCDYFMWKRWIFYRHKLFFQICPGDLLVYSRVLTHKASTYGQLKYIINEIKTFKNISYCWKINRLNSFSIICYWNDNYLIKQKFQHKNCCYCQRALQEFTANLHFDDCHHFAWSLRLKF